MEKEIMRKDLNFMTNLVFSILLYWLYLHFIIDLFHIVPTLDYMVAIGHQPLDFGFQCHLMNGEAFDINLPALEPLESSSRSDSLSTGHNPYEIYQRIQILEAREYYNIPPENHPGDYERLVREHLSRARALGDDFYRAIYEREYFEVRVLEKKGLLQDRLTNLMLNEHNIDRIMEISPYSDVRKEAYHFIQDRFPPLNINSLEYPLRLQQRYIMDENLNSINFFVTDLERNHSRSEFYQQFYRVFTDE